jgi:transglutaminase-like putative cysteine protease
VQSLGHHAAFLKSLRGDRLAVGVNCAFPKKPHTTDGERTTARNATHLSGGQHCERIFGEMAPVKLGSPTIPIYFFRIRLTETRSSRKTGGLRTRYAGACVVPCAPYNKGSKLSVEPLSHGETLPIRVALHHKTTYRYDRRVTLSPQVVRLRPAPHCRTPITAYSLKIDPANHFINWQQDPHSNYLARVVFPEPVRHFQVEVDLVAEMTIINPFDFFLEPCAETFPFRYEASLEHELAAYLLPEPVGGKLAEYLANIDRSPKQIINFLVALNQQLQSHIGYVIRLEPGIQTPEFTLTQRTGSCRDSAWLFVQILRNLGLAARFVSGYLIQLKPDVKPLDGPAGPTSDFTDLHAWTEVYLPGAGWVGLDATSGLFAGEGHIPLAATPQPSGAAPVTGGVDPCEVAFEHVMEVTRIHEDPRVTLPYTDAQWEKIEALGHQIDLDLRAGDVRLTMGGEPTFVSIDHMEAPEWSTEALGDEKFALGGQLLRRLKDSFAPGALLHYGQGKWYPGEQLPRWSMGCFWRLDGIPMWDDYNLLAKPETPSSYKSQNAANFIKTLARRLGLGEQYINPAFEDSFYYLHNERRLPVNVDTQDSRVADIQERDRVRAVFERGLSEPTGYVLPLQRGEGQGSSEWQTSLWMLRGDQLFLLPGDSPVGLRLPLSSLPWIAPEDARQVHPVDPMAQRLPLPVPLHFSPDDPQLRHAHDPARDKTPGPKESAKWIVRTALCVEARQGKLCIFMPPADRIEDYLELLTAIEDTAALLKMPVVIEGYTPPHDPRISNIKVTPDPGVIEVNIHPAHSWDELVNTTNVVYDQARLSRLGTE